MDARLGRRELMQGAGAAFVLANASPARAEIAGDWSPALGRVVEMAREQKLLALVVHHRGEAILSYGDTARPRTVHSMRKSFISALFGQAVARGDVKLAITLGELEIDDDPVLTETEKSATIEDLLKARSGVYLPLAPGLEARWPRPPRGSNPPNSQWCYSNWDFNVLGNIYERLTGRDFFVAFAHDIAAPIGMQDFDPYRDGRYHYGADSMGATPRYPNYRISLSARDRARFGQLYRQKGRWGSAHILPSEWVDRSTRVYSETGQPGTQAGYGYLWWIGRPEAGAWPAGIPRPTVHTAYGAYGHCIGIIPERDLVIVTVPDTEGATPHPVDREQYEALIQAVCAALPTTHGASSS